MDEKMKYTGIWMDKSKAIVVSIEKGKEKMDTILSEIEDFRIKGGSGSRMKGGPQDVVQDSRYLEREKGQFKIFFKKLVPFIEDCDAVVILGPAQAGNKFSKALSEDHRDLYSKVQSVEKTDNMTDNELKAWVREYFG